MAEQEVPHEGMDGKSEPGSPEKTPCPEDAARAEMAAAVERHILSPLGLLSGLFASVPEEMREDIDPESIAALLGLMVRGARAELAIHKEGGYPVKALREMLGERITVEV